jgi:CheY-like chemotaxis protein
MQRYDLTSHTQKLQSLGQLAGGVAHDFNNILSIIEGYARMLERQIGHDALANEKLQHILLATQRGANITKRLLSFGRQNIMLNSVCDIVQVVRESELLLKPLMAQRLTIQMDLPDKALYVACDSDVIIQILINLAVNSRDAVRDNGTVWLHINADNQDKVILLITDNGVGIADTLITRIFEPFFTTKSQGQGTGLGLSMVAGVMQQVGGTIDVESKLGHGTQFQLTFPKAEAPQNKLHSLDTKDVRSFDKKTILIVDDEELLLPILQVQLQELGLKVLQAANAEKALIIQEEYPESIDFLLTDIVMPGLNGVRLAELFTSLRPNTGVIYMTGYPNRVDENYYQQLPKDSLVLPKPFQPQLMISTLEQALKRVQNMTVEEII